MLYMEYLVNLMKHENFDTNTAAWYDFAFKPNHIYNDVTYKAFIYKNDNKGWIITSREGNISTTEKTFKDCWDKIKKLKGFN